MKRAKSVSFIGGPFSGKSTVASQVNSILKTEGFNSTYIEEYAAEFIIEYGVPSGIEHQMIIFDNQMKKEQLFKDSRDYIVCDSASWLSYIYARSNVSFPISKLDGASLNHLNKKALDSLAYWDYIFYVPLMEDYKTDGVRYHNEQDAKKIDRMIKSWLDFERVPYIDLSSMKEDRINFVIDKIVK